MALFPKILHNEGMKILLFLALLSYGCSQVKPKPPIDEDDVSLEAALNQAQSSYLLGCVEASKTSKISPAFPVCRDRARNHRREIEEIIKQVPLPTPVTKPL